MQSRWAGMFRRGVGTTIRRVQLGRKTSQVDLQATGNCWLRQEKPFSNMRISRLI